jgi:hypothetical protein
MVAAIFTGNPYFALLAGIGSFIPDLDREYILVSRKTFKEEELHRALFHNLLFLSALFFINQWLAIGAFMHCFIDSFTTEKDRGVEWLFPFSRLVKRGKYALAAKEKNGSCRLDLVDQKTQDRVSFLNEDSPEMTKISAPDLKENKPIPWRRTYGPAENNQMLDKFLGLGSFSLFIVYSIVNFNFGLAGRQLLFSTRMFAPMSLLTGIVLIYLGGWLKKNNKPRKHYLIPFIFAAIFLPLSAVLSSSQILTYQPPFNPVFALASAIVLTLEAVLVWRLSIRGGKKAIV